MKKLLLCIGLACVGVTGCLNPSYSVSRDAVEEMLTAEQLAVTPFQPAWLSESGENMWQLPAETKARVCAILLAGTSRYVPELAYQTDDVHAPLVQNRFYIYASNGQCLAGTVLGNRVAMHDVELELAQEQELYQILKPYLKRLFTGLL